MEQNKNGVWFWKLSGENGECLAVSESYSSKSMYLKTVKIVAQELRIDFYVESGIKVKL